MASWLSNVGSFLEKLDDQAERVVDDVVTQHRHRQHSVEKAEILEEVEAGALESVLAARGLLPSSSTDDDEFDEDDVLQEQVVFEDDLQEQVVFEDVDDDDAGEEKPAAAFTTDDTPLLEDGWNTEFSEHSATTTEGRGGDEGRDAPVESNQKQKGTSTMTDTMIATGALKNDDDENDDAVAQQHQQGGDDGVDTAATTTTTTTVSSAADSSPSPEDDDPANNTVVPPATKVSNAKAEGSSAATADDESKKSSPTEETAPSTILQKSTKSSAAAAAAATATVSGNSSSSPSAVAAATATREAQKEARTLRRHVLTLNKQLETAEAEIQAQRSELERAAERLEKDRIRFKDEREKEKARHAQEVALQKQQNDQVCKDVKQRTDKQVEELRLQLRNVEERRMQEGGDWNKELVDALQRNEDLARTQALLEDERATLLSQIATLQDQQAALGNRLESLSQTADNAMDREREAENRLDEALSLHARQISQRQSREAELERTVSELGSALVIARTKLSSFGKEHGSSSSGGNNNNNGNDESCGSPTHLQVEALQQELEVLAAQLAHEQQRSQALQNELRDISKERAEEASSSHSNQIHNDRKIAELSHTVARLESELLNTRNSGTSNGGMQHLTNTSDGNNNNKNSNGGEELKQIKYLSEEVMRHREQLSNCSSEISALKSRLHVANARATKAEAALEEVEQNGNNTNGGGGGDSWSDVEMAPSSGGNNLMRRRGGGRRSPTNRTVPTMRSALHLGPGQSTEKIGKALDGIDVFLVESGKFLRYNPLARLLFIVYLLILHLWTFALFFFYAHGFETVHGDFGAGHGVPHGPHALMEQHPALQHSATSVATAGQPVVAAAAATISNVTIVAAGQT